MERAVFHTDAPPAPEDVAGCDRLYFGSETCELLMPTPSSVARARDAAESAGVAFTLVSSWLTDTGMELFLRLLSCLRPGDEVVAGDWGLLVRMARDWPRLQPVAGRLLTRAPRDPRLACRVLDGDAARPAPRFQPSSDFLDMLRSLGVRRLEIDAPSPGDGGACVPEGFFLSVHAPPSLLTLTRNCPWRAALAPGSLGTSRCPRPCRGRAARLVGRDAPAEYILRWNAWFAPSEALAPASLPAAHRYVRPAPVLTEAAAS